VFADLAPGTPTALPLHRQVPVQEVFEREILTASGAFAGTAAVRCDVAAPAITGAKLLRNGLENVTFTGRKL